MLNIILVANSQDRARMLVRELLNHNRDTLLKPYPTILTDKDKSFQLAAFSKDNVEAIRGLHADQMFLEEDMIMDLPEHFQVLLDTLRYSYVPVDYRIIKLKEDY